MRYAIKCLMTALSILWTIPTNALELNPEIVLNRNQTAPWRGVLVPEYQYRVMKADAAEKEILINQVQGLENNLAECNLAPVDTKTGLILFLAGGLFGVAAVLIAQERR